MIDTSLNQLVNGARCQAKSLSHLFDLRVAAGVMDPSEQQAWAYGVNGLCLTAVLDVLGSGYDLGYRVSDGARGSTYFHVDAPHARFTLRLSTHPMPRGRSFHQRAIDEAPTMGLDLAATDSEVTLGSIVTEILTFLALVPRTPRTPRVQSEHPFVPQGTLGLMSPGLSSPERQREAQ